MSDQSLSLSCPADRAQAAVWTGDDFVVEGRHERILMYDIAPSGWTDELTQIHDEIGGGDHFTEIASRNHAMSEIERCLPSGPLTILEVGCSSGFLLKDISRILPQHRLVGVDYTAGTCAGWSDIIRFKILKNIGVRNRSWIEALVPWFLLSRLADNRFKVSAHSIGIKRAGS